MKADASTVKTWEKTRLQNLVRHKSGGYYARLFLNGKEVWRSLKTKHFSVAESRLTEALKEHRQRKGQEASASSIKMTFRQAAELHLTELDGKPNIKRRTKEYWREIYTSLQKTWPSLAEMQIRQITKRACREWAAGFAKEGCSTRYNNTIAFLRHVIAVAVESGVVYTNVADGLERKAVKSKQLELPTLAEFSVLIAEMSIPKGRYSIAAADFAQGLAYTGCRVSEARRIEWRDLNFATGEILIKGDPKKPPKMVKFGGFP